ncbi:hypothetical protein AK830_g10685 [Neonectria ditissima]|uniref:NACHT domain-containing protein n=1 Tax=Neonectria ditissima TaxID=78410 RepID=A0A0P7AF82_9HYPO|nr:hypothetical protein AK830_g10685 [Neonectria ditissima]
MNKSKSQPLRRLFRSFLSGKPGSTAVDVVQAEDQQSIDDGSSPLLGLQSAEQSPTPTPEWINVSSDSLQRDGSSATAPNTAEEPDPSIRLWNKAYNSIKANNAELVIVFEEILTERMEGRSLIGSEDVNGAEDASSQPLPNAFNYYGRSRLELMNQAVQKSLERAQKNERIESGLLDISNVIKDLEKVGSAVLSPYPPAAMAWSGICAILPVITRHVEAKEAMIEGLNHIISKMTWYMGLSSAIVDDPWKGSPRFVKLKASIEQRIVGIYESMLQYQMQSVAHCYSRHPKTQNMKTMLIRPTEWKSRVEAIKTSEKELESELAQYASRQSSDISRSIAQDTQSTLKHWQQQFSQAKLDERAALTGQFKTTAYEQHMKFNPPRAPGTCEWLLKNEKFDHWKQQNHGVLVISADPGCGKSVLSRHLVENVLPYGDSPTTVCYFFFKDCPEQRSLSNAICALLHRIFYQTSNLVDPCKEQIRAGGQTLNSDSTTLWRIFETAVSHTKARQTICVLDGLDECDAAERRTFIRLLSALIRPGWLSPPSVKFLITTRGYPEILEEFERFPACTVISTESKQEKVAMRQEINRFVQYRLRELSTKKSLSQDSQDLIRMTLQGEPSEPRTYLWVSLVFDVLDQNFEDTIHRWQKLLRHTPKTVFEAYEKLLQRTSKGDKEKVKLLFHLVIAAERPLAVPEMKVALYVRDAEGASSEDDLYLPSDEKFLKWMLGACGLLLTVFDDRIFFIHRTAKEFLLWDDNIGVETDEEKTKALSEWEGSVTMPQAHRSMAESCIAYLSLGVVKDERFYKVTEAFNSGLGEAQNQLTAGELWPSQFLDVAYAPLHQFIENLGLGLSSYAVYALQYWLSHFDAAQEYADDGSLIRDINQEFDDRYFSLFDEELPIKSPWLVMAAQVLEEDCGYQLTQFNKTTRDVLCHDSVSLVSLAALFDHHRLIRRLLEGDASSEHDKTPEVPEVASHDNLVISPPDTKYQPVFFAAAAGHARCLEYVLTKSVLIDLEDARKRTPLHQVARLGRYDCLKSLANQFDVNDKDDVGWTAIDYLARRIREVKDFDIGSEIVRDLVSKRGQSSGQVSLLALAAKLEPESSRELRRLERQYGSGFLDDPRTATEAVESGLFKKAYTESFIKFLVDHGEDVNFHEVHESAELSGYTPLHHASRGHFWNVMFLLQAGADANATDVMGHAPLHIACGWNSTVNIAIVVALLEAGASPNLSDAEGITPASLAILHPWEAGDVLVESMLPYRADFQSPDENGQTLTEKAQILGHENRDIIIAQWVDTKCLHDEDDQDKDEDTLSPHLSG